MPRLFLSVAIIIAFALAAASCGTVRQEDLDAWVGQPVSMLDTQPFFISLPMVRTVTPDGIEIRNYVNGQNVSSCFGSGLGAADASGNGQTVTAYANYQNFANCVSRFDACANIFFIKDGRVVEYVPTPVGRARCITDDRVRPRKIGG